MATPVPLAFMLKQMFGGVLLGDGEGVLGTGEGARDDEGVLGTGRGCWGR